MDARVGDSCEMEQVALGHLEYISPHHRFKPLSKRAYNSDASGELTLASRLSNDVHSGTPGRAGSADALCKSARLGRDVHSLLHRNNKVALTNELSLSSK